MLSASCRQKYEVILICAKFFFIVAICFSWTPARTEPESLMFLGVTPLFVGLRALLSERGGECFELIIPYMRSERSVWSPKKTRGSLCTKTGLLSKSTDMILTFRDETGEGRGSSAVVSLNLRSSFARRAEKWRRWGVAAMWLWRRWMGCFPKFGRFCVKQALEFNIWALGS